MQTGSAFSEISKEKGHVHIILIGDGLIRKKLESEVIEKGVSGNVTFTGIVNRKQIPDFIQAMDICIIPHSNNFGSPIVLF